MTKLSRLELQSDQARQAENLRKFLLALSEDIRVLLVKLADRLHNMRTLHHVPDDEKRQRVARETMEIYAPLAERIGLQAFKAELEDPRLQGTQPRRLRDDGDAAQGAPRSRPAAWSSGSPSPSPRRSGTNGCGPPSRAAKKRPYSIWEKMQRKKLAFEQMTDIVGFRVVTDSEGGLLPGARHRASRVPDGAGPLQGLHLDAQAKRVPLAPHCGDRTGAAAHRNPDSHPRHARGGPVWRRRPLALQAGGRRS